MQYRRRTERGRISVSYRLPINFRHVTMTGEAFITAATKRADAEAEEAAAVTREAKAHTFSLQCWTLAAITWLAAGILALGLILPLTVAIP